MMTIAQILNNIEWGRKQRAEFVQIISYRYGYKRSDLMPKAIAKAYSKKPGYTSPYRYVCTIECANDKSQVKMSCSCPDFVFSGNEYRLAQRGAADIIYGNGEPPQAKAKPGCCKHLFMLVKELRKNKKLRSDLTFSFPKPK